MVQRTPIASFNFSIPVALAAAGKEVAIVLPFYPQIPTKLVQAEKTDISFSVAVSDTVEQVDLFTGKLPGSSITLFLLSSRYFDRDDIYGNHTGEYPDNNVRFSLFSRAVLHLVKDVAETETIVCSDWYTSLVPVYLQESCQRFGLLTQVKTVLSVFDLQKQGRFWLYDLHLLNLGWDVFTPEKLEFYHDINFLKGGIVYADTVLFPLKKSLDFIDQPDACYELQGVLSYYRDKVRASGSDDISIRVIKSVGNNK